MIHMLILVTGIIVGIALSFLLRRKSNDPPLGNIIFDESVGYDVPYLAVRRASDIDIIRTRRHVTLKVDIIKSRTQK